MNIFRFENIQSQLTWRIYSDIHSIDLICLGHIRISIQVRQIYSIKKDHTKCIYCVRRVPCLSDSVTVSHALGIGI